MTNTGHAALKRAAAILALLCVGALAGAPRGVSAATSPEYLLKAAHLYKFALFTEWPKDAFPSPDSPITIGVLGTDPFGQVFDDMVEGKRINNRRIVVKRMQWGQDVRQCQMLFISSADASRLPELAPRIAGLPILVVGESADLARRGATINFRVEDNFVKFDVNVEAAKRARLSISSQVLKLARIVKDL